jgi:hypothetical protein
MSAICSALCCAGNCCCHGINNIFQDSKKINPKLFARIGFIVLNVICIIFSLVILYFGASLLKPFNSFIHCPDTNDDDKFNCLGISSVYRMSLALFLLHLVVIGFSLISQKCAKAINIDCWTFKLLFVSGTYFALFFVSNGFFAIYAEVSRYLSIIFLLYQSLVSISLAHIINIKIVEGYDKASEEGKGTFKYQFWLFALSGLFSALTLYWLITCVLNYGLSWRLIIIIATACCGIGFTILSISSLVTRRRLLTSLYLFSFISYLCWSAFDSEPNDSEKLEIHFWDIFIGLCYVFLALLFLGFYIKKKPENTETEEQKVINKNPLLEQESEPKKNDEELLKKDDEEEVKVEELDISKAYILFHIFMMFMSVYYCMLLTNWNIVDPESSKIITQTWSSFWVKIIILFSTVLLYVWVLIAPRILPDREFEF